MLWELSNEVIDEAGVVVEGQLATFLNVVAPVWGHKLGIENPDEGNNTPLDVTNSLQ